MLLPCSRSSVSTVSLASQNTVAITLQADTITRSWEVTKKRVSRPCFARYFRNPSNKPWCHLQSQIMKLKLSEVSLNRQNRLVNASIRSGYWTSDNICSTHCAETLFINKFSCKIKCTLPVEMPTDAATKPTDSRRSVLTSLLTFSTVSSSGEVTGRPRWSLSCKFSMSLCNCSVSESTLR